jgi:BASS family bile acid:Na+ symporter
MITQIKESTSFNTIALISHYVHKHFVLLLLVSYAIAVIYPSLGLQIRSISLCKFNLMGEEVNLSGPMLMLSFLLFNAGFGTKTTELKELETKPLILIGGFMGNILVPVIFILVMWILAGHWHNPDEAQNILVGLALIASMPIAGSSTAWSQNANGNMVLSIGLVLVSTVLSPLITPLILKSASQITIGDYSTDLAELAQSGTKTFLTMAVVIPTLTGMFLRLLVSQAHTKKITVWLKSANSLILLLLIYSNACVCLPQTLSNPDWDLLFLILAITILLCLIMFSSAYFIAKALKTSENDKIALLFGLGMNNNGTGLVLASMQLADHPAVLLPIVFYNLIQHLVAGAVYWILSKTNSERSELY